MDKAIFELVVLEEAREFLISLPAAIRKKIAYNIRKVQYGVKDAELFKKMENSEIWEFRTRCKGMSYRLFSFWDTEEDSLVIATNGLVKKTQKTPSKDLVKAERIMKRYFELKKQEKK